MARKRKKDKKKNTAKKKIKTPDAKAGTAAAPATPATANKIPVKSLQRAAAKAGTAAAPAATPATVAKAPVETGERTEGRLPKPAKAAGAAAGDKSPKTAKTDAAGAAGDRSLKTARAAAAKVVGRRTSKPARAAAGAAAAAAAPGGAAPASVRVEAETGPQKNLIYWMAFWGLAVLLFVSPFFRGLFFPPEQQRALMFAAVIFWLVWLWKWLQRDYRFLSHPLDYLALAFPAVYIISTFGAANYGLAVDEVVKAALYFLVYWTAARLVNRDGDAVRILHVFYLSAVAVSLAGLATATGIIHIKDGFLGGRIYGPFQYPNALASYLAAMAFIGVYLWQRSADFTLARLAGGEGRRQGLPGWVYRVNPFPYLYAAGNLLIFAVFVGARSNGGFIVISLALLLFMIGLPRGRGHVFWHLAFTWVPAGFVIARFLAAVKAENMDGAWLWVFAGMLAVLAGQLIINQYRSAGLQFGEKAGRKLAKYRKAVIALALVAALAAAAAGSFLAWEIFSGGAGAAKGAPGENPGQTAVSTTFDQELVNKIRAKLKIHNAYNRAYFIMDAVEMIKDRPLTGWGGGGWEEAYRSYQDYLYDSNEVHSYYAQLGVETGVPGLLLTLALLAVFLRSAHRVYYGSRDNLPRKMLLWGIFVSAAVLCIHAVIDFDLSLSAIALVWWSMFAMTGRLEQMQVAGGVEQAAAAQNSAQKATGKTSPRASKKSKKRAYAPRKGAVLAGASTAALLIFLAGGILAMAGSQAGKAGEALKARNLKAAIEHMERAAGYNPFNPSYYTDLARLYSAAGEAEKAVEAGKKALARGSHHPSRYSSMVSLYYQQGEVDKAIEYAEKAVARAPFKTDYYDGLSRTCFLAGFNALNDLRKAAGEKERAEIEAGARQYFARAAEIPERIRAASESIPPEKKWLTKPVRMTPVTMLNVGISQYFLGQWKEAEQNLTRAAKNKKAGGEALLWLSILRDKQGKAEEAAKLLRQAEELVPKLARNYEQLKSMPVLKN